MRVLLQKKKDIVCAAVILAAAVAVQVLVGLPRQEAVDRKRTRIKSLDQQIQQSTLAANEMTALIVAASDLSDIYQHTEGDILPLLLKLIDVEGKRHDVEILSMKPSTAERIEIKGQVDIESNKQIVAVAVRAKYRDLGNYLKSLESLPVLVAVRDLRISQAEQASGRLRATFNIETYSIRTDDEKTQ